MIEQYRIKVLPRNAISDDPKENGGLDPAVFLVERDAAKGLVQCTEAEFLADVCDLLVAIEKIYRIMGGAGLRISGMQKLDGGEWKDISST